MLRILIKKLNFGSNPMGVKIMTKDTKWVLYTRTDKQTGINSQILDLLRNKAEKSI